MTIPALRCSIAPAAPDTESSELLVLGPSLGTTSALWQPALDHLRQTSTGSRLRVLRFDLPGHGVSEPARAPFTVEDIAAAVLQLVDETGGGRFHYTGLSLGGAVGIALALDHSDRLASLTLFCTDAKIASGETWRARSVQVRGQGTASLVSASAERWFAPGFLARDETNASRTLHELTQVDDESYALCSDALAAFDRRAELGSITAPTLTVGGEFDQVTPDAALAALAAAIPGARHATLADASHLAALEQPAQTARLIASNVSRGAASEPDGGGLTSDQIRARGMAIRRQVLGDAHVDRAIASTTAETEPFQDFITRYAWGDIWARPGLSRRDRSVVTLASLTTAGHHNEIGMHVRAALTNGLTRNEITEILLHTGVYAGVPASNAAFAIAREIFAELDRQSADRRPEGVTRG